MTTGPQDYGHLPPPTEGSGYSAPPPPQMPVQPVQQITINTGQQAPPPRTQGAGVKDPKTFRILSAVGFIGIGGLQYFYLNRWGQGLLYLLTGGLFFIGTIHSLVMGRDICDRYNASRGNIKIIGHS